MNFATSQPRPDGPGWRPWPYWPAAKPLAMVLLGCCALAVTSTAFPWVRVLVPSLWGQVDGPIAARTDAGFTCLLTCLLTAMLVLAEGSSQQAREAVRTGCMVMMAIAGSVLGWQLWQGPGTLRDVSLAHSGWFFAAAIAVGVATCVCRLRLPRAASAAGRSGSVPSTSGPQ